MFAPGTDIMTTSVSSVKDSGADYTPSSWCVQTVGGLRLLVYIDQMVQLQGKLLRVPDRADWHRSDLVFARVFHFSFDQLRAEVQSNTIRFSAQRMVELLRRQHKRLERGQDSFACDALPSHLTRTRMSGSDGCWAWHVVSMTELLGSDEAFRPIHLSSRIDDDNVVFMFR